MNATEPTIPAVDFANIVTGLAHNRRTGSFSSLPISMLHLKTEALAAQAGALEAYDSDFRGYAIIGSSKAARRTLQLTEPIFSPLPERDVHHGPSRLRLPQGMLGAQCEFVFTLGRTYPAPDEPIDRETVAYAIAACQPAIGLLGRRTSPGPDSELTAIADFALHVATITGSTTETVDFLALDQCHVSANINGATVIETRADEILGHPVDAVVWLARQLSRQGKKLNADDVVASGTCAPILQVLPGQTLDLTFTAVGTVSCAFD